MLASLSVSCPSKSPSMELVQQNHPHAQGSVTASSSSPSPRKQLQPIPNEAICQASLTGTHDAIVVSSVAAEADQFSDEEEELNNFNNNQNRQQDAFLNSFPPGYRFNPRDDEIVLYYLQKKIMNEPLPPNKIMAVNLYRHNPETLAERYETYGEKEWYFFTPRDRKYRNGFRPNRAAGEGYWKATGADKMIKSSNVVVGCRKALVFYRGKPPKGKKTNWIMHEYRVPDSRPPKRTVNDMRLDNWVLCRMYKKADNKYKSQTPTYSAEESISTSQPDNMEMEINGQVDNSQAMDQSKMENPYTILPPPSEFVEAYSNYTYAYPSTMLHQHQIQPVDLGQMQQACDSSSLMQFHHGQNCGEHKRVVQSQDQKRIVQSVDLISETYKLCSDKRYGMQFVQRPPTMAYSHEKSSKIVQPVDAADDKPLLVLPSADKKSAEQEIQKPLLSSYDQGLQYIEESNEECLWKLFHVPNLGAMF